MCRPASAGSKEQDPACINSSELPIRSTRLWRRRFMRGLYVAIGLALAVGGAACSQNSGQALAASDSSAVLSGVVTSEKEGPMEGVLVSAKLGTVTTTVVTGKEGRYAFP